MAAVTLTRNTETSLGGNAGEAVSFSVAAAALQALTSSTTVMVRAYDQDGLQIVSCVFSGGPTADAVQAPAYSCAVHYPGASSMRFTAELITATALASVSCDVTVGAP